MTRISYKDKASVGNDFLINLLKVFLITNIICLSASAYIYLRLVRYENSTPEGSIRNYLSLVSDKKYHEIYEESKLVFPQFNTEEIYVNYLKELYNDKDLKNITLSKESYSDSKFLYYKINDLKNNNIANVQLKKDGDLYHVRTLTSIWNFDFDVVDNLEFSINDVKVEDEYITEKDVHTKAYSGMDNQKNIAQVKRYHLDNFVNIPEVTALNDKATVVKDVIQDQFYVGYKPTADVKEEYESMLLDLAQTYSKYITEDEKFYNLRKLLHKDTEFFKNISSFNNGWFSPHNSVDFKNIEIYDIVVLNENSFIGSVKYDYEVIANHKVQTYPTIYQMFFVKENGNWLCTNLLLGK